MSQPVTRHFTERKPDEDEVQANCFPADLGKRISAYLFLWDPTEAALAAWVKEVAAQRKDAGRNSHWQAAPRQSQGHCGGAEIITECAADKGAPTARTGLLCLRLRKAGGCGDRARQQWRPL